MSLKRKASGAFTRIATTYKRRASGSWTNIGLIYRRLSGAWVLAAQWLVYVVGATVDGAGPNSASSRTRFRLNTSGVAEGADGAIYSTLYTWLLSGASSAYEARATIVSNTASASVGTFNTWIATNTSPEWYAQMSSSGTGTLTLTIEIRRASDSLVLDTATVYLNSEFV